jgi:RimJ/RimL family protein N-acetyltransferase
MTTFPDAVLTAGRLTLRPLRDADQPAIVAAASDPVTQAWLPLPFPYEAQHAQWFVTEFAPGVLATGRGIVRAIELDGELAGCIDLKRTDWAARTTEIGYWAVPSFRGRGVLTEATAALARWALTEVGLLRVELRAAAGNVASQRVAEKAGFQREGVARSAGYTHDGQVDLVIYSLIQADLGVTKSAAGDR